MTEEKHAFQAEVSRLLQIVAHSLYSEKEIFLRELISNASDACDKLRYLALTAPDLLTGDADLKIRISVNKEQKLLTISDNGVGMNRDELVQNLGTIARSGTAAFLEKLSGDATRSVSMIGQFGVGFYSAFMVADKVEVFSRHAGETHGWCWTSDGKGEYRIGAAEDVSRGTRITLHMRDDSSEFLEQSRIAHIVRKYSDHIALPIIFVEGETETPLNQASALWTRKKADITAEQYTEFYRHVGHNFDEPWLTLHQKAEGKIEYTALLFVPTDKPIDLFQPERRHRVKLYVRRVFITDECEGLIPSYLRFLRGIVDSEDLPLNVSREMLQDHPTLTAIRKALVKRVFSALDEKAKENGSDYLRFWETFGAVVKEGLYEDFENREKILKLARFRSTRGEALVSLDDYLTRMKPEQTAIYVLSGDNPDALAKSPQIEGFKARDIEVLLLSDPVDDFWLGLGMSYNGKTFTSVTKGAADLDKIAPAKESEKKEDAPSDATVATLVALFKQSLGDQVKDVRTSNRLTSSPVCLVAADGDMDMHLARVLRQSRQVSAEQPRVLEINPTHPLIVSLSKVASDGHKALSIADAAHLLFDQARILEGEQLSNPSDFSRRLNDLLIKAI